MWIALEETWDEEVGEGMEVDIVGFEVGTRMDRRGAAWTRGVNRGTRERMEGAEDGESGRRGGTGWERWMGYVGVVRTSLEL